MRSAAGEDSRAAVIGREGDERVSQPDARFDVIEQRGDLPVGAERDVHRLVAVRAEAVADVVVSREADGQHVRVGVRAQRLVVDCLLREVEDQIVAERRVVNRPVEARAGSVRAARQRVREAVRVAALASRCR